MKPYSLFFLLFILVVIGACKKDNNNLTSNNVVITFAGANIYGSQNGIGTNASFHGPSSVAVDAMGNVYVADRINNLIRKITAGSVVTTLAGSLNPGSANGTGSSASFNYPTGVAVDDSGNVYVADYGNNMIRKITAAGMVTTLAGSGSQGSFNGIANTATFYAPAGLAVDDSGNVYVADQGNNLIRKISTNGIVTTVAGSGAIGSVNGIGTAAAFNQPASVALDAGRNIYVADRNNNLIRKISPSGIVTTLAGSGNTGSATGTGTDASFYYPTGIAVDASGNIYVADYANCMIRKVTSFGLTITLAGSGVPGAINGYYINAQFNGPTGVAVDSYGNVYVADQGNNLIRKIQH